MRLSSITHRPHLRAVAIIAALGAIALCARPMAGRPVPPQGGAVVQIRDFPAASIVEIVAWDVMSPAYGIRTWVRRNGGVPDRYHRFWVNSDYTGARDVVSVSGLNRPMQLSNATDNQNCFNGKCSPTSTIGARVPDGALRASKEDLAVKFVTNSGSEINLAARRSLVDAYLAAVDSVSKALKK